MTNKEFFKGVEETRAKIVNQIRENPCRIDCQMFCKLTGRDFLKDDCKICGKFEWRR